MARLSGLPYRFVKRDTLADSGDDVGLVDVCVGPCAERKYLRRERFTK